MKTKVIGAIILVLIIVLGVKVFIITDKVQHVIGKMKEWEVYYNRQYNHVQFLLENNIQTNQLDSGLYIYLPPYACSSCVYDLMLNKEISSCSVIVSTEEDRKIYRKYQPILVTEKFLVEYPNEMPVLIYVNNDKKIKMIYDYFKAYKKDFFNQIVRVRSQY